VLHAKEDAGQVDVDDLVELLEWDIREGVELENAGVVDEDIELAELALGLRDDVLPLLLGRDVQVAEADAIAELVGERLALVVEMSAATTEAPSSCNRRTIAAPMPRDPPVTSATLPSNLCIWGLSI